MRFQTLISQTHNTVVARWLKATELFQKGQQDGYEDA